MNHIHEAGHAVIAELLGYEVLIHTPSLVHVVPLPEGEDWAMFNWAGVIADVSISRQRYHLTVVHYLAMFFRKPASGDDGERLVRIATTDPAMCLRAFRRTRKLLLRHWDRVLETALATCGPNWTDETAALQNWLNEKLEA